MEQYCNNPVAGYQLYRYDEDRQELEPATDLSALGHVNLMAIASIDSVRERLKKGKIRWDGRI